MTIAPKLARRLRTVAIVAVITFVLLEAVLPLFDWTLAKSFKKSAPKPFLEDAQAFLDEPRFEFDPDLGWDSNPPYHHHEEGKTYFAQAYGDSFTESGHGGLTWQFMFEELTGHAILNCGEWGYGLDQAVLKFEKYHHVHKPCVAMLGLYSSTFRRCLAYHSYYYFSGYAEYYRYAFKPIFVRDGDGFRLVPPPCRPEQHPRWADLLDPFRRGQ